mmetsp:Transcript_101114/g.311799  ORF Transcript_101114/g.311799 Transcript_101114/m.311799 type:complete len:249 (+) Transcript_101114:645-1391(+)
MPLPIRSLNRLTVMDPFMSSCASPAKCPDSMTSRNSRLQTQASLSASKPAKILPAWELPSGLWRTAAAETNSARSRQSLSSASKALNASCGEEKVVSSRDMKVPNIAPDAGTGPSATGLETGPSDMTPGAAPALSARTGAPGDGAELHAGCELGGFADAVGGLVVVGLVVGALLAAGVLLSRSAAAAPAAEAAPPASTGALRARKWPARKAVRNSSSDTCPLPSASKPSKASWASLSVRGGMKASAPE